MTSVSTPSTSSAAGPNLSVRQLEFFYGAHQVLFGVDLEVLHNEILALIGPSGCGKSTFLRCLNRLNELIPGARLSGEVRLGGQNIYAPGTDLMQLRRRVGMVFQRPNLFPLSIAGNIAFGLRINGLAHGRRAEAERIEQSLRSAGLWEEVKDRLRRPALALSGGQQQRLCIARALAIEPEILLMDEPASALDPIATARIEDLARELKEHYTIVMVTHNLQQAARLSDRTCFFLSGRVVETGTTSRLFAQPVHQATEDYITGRFG